MMVPLNDVFFHNHRPFRMFIYGSKRLILDTGCLLYNILSFIILSMLLWLLCLGIERAETPHSRGTKTKKVHDKSGRSVEDVKKHSHQHRSETSRHTANDEKRYTSKYPTQITQALQRQRLIWMCCAYLISTIYMLLIDSLFSHIEEIYRVSQNTYKQHHWRNRAKMFSASLPFRMAARPHEIRYNFRAPADKHHARIPMKSSRVSLHARVKQRPAKRF